MRPSIKSGAVTAALALIVLTGCGSDRSGEAATGESNEETAAASAVTFGDLESPCGDGDASGATDQGVTDDAITIGYGDDSGFAAAPGLSQEAGDAVEAMIAWCNDQGGINGRQIKGNRYDAALTDAAVHLQAPTFIGPWVVGPGSSAGSPSMPRMTALVEVMPLTASVKVTAMGPVARAGRETNAMGGAWSVAVIVRGLTPVLGLDCSLTSPCRGVGIGRPALALPNCN